jgi:hypothetical protein
MVRSSFFHPPTCIEGRKEGSSFRKPRGCQKEGRKEGKKEGRKKGRLCIIYKTTCMLENRV